MAHNSDDEEEIDPVKAAKLEIAQTERIKRDIRKHAGLENDEIETLLPTFEALKKFHAEMMHLHSSNDEDYLSEGDDGKEPEESEDILTPDEKKRAEELKGVKRKKAFNDKAAQDAFEKAGAHLPEEQRASGSDLQRLLDQLNDDEED